nr:alpha/beta hydrolase [Streptomyces sp. SID5468]
MTTAADGWGALMGAMDAARTRTDHGIAAPVRAEQKGEAADAMAARLDRLGRNYQYVYQESGYLRSILAALADELAPYQRALNAALDEAHEAGFTVGDDGSVSYPAATTPAPGSSGAGTARGGDLQAPYLPGHTPQDQLNPNRAKAQEIADRIAGAVRAATETDERYARLLTKVTAQPDYAVTDATWADVAADATATRALTARALHLDAIPSTNDPKANAQWWNDLGPERQQEYLALYPDRIGALDGLPAAVRDRANRVVLAEQRGLVEQQLAELGPLGPEPPFGDPRIPATTAAWRHWEERRKAREPLEGRLKGMQALQDRLDAGDRGESADAYLLLFDLKGNGHSAVSFGNPDAADNVVTYVPGTGSKLSDIDGHLKRAADLQNAAQRADPQRRTASIVWQGYDAPQGVFSDAMEAKFADSAAPSLDRFLGGVRVAHEDAPFTSTLLGHSYGTLVAGKAMTVESTPPVDQVIFVASPGVGVDHARDLGLPPEKVWSATARNDLINLAPPDPGPLAPLNPNAYARWFDDHSILYGNDPTSSAFGGRIFQVPPGKAPGSDGFMPAHSQYWEGDSLQSLARIVTKGKPN